MRVSKYSGLSGIWGSWRSTQRQTKGRRRRRRRRRCRCRCRLQQPVCHFGLAFPRAGNRRLGIPLDAFLAVTRQQSCMSSIIFVVVSVTSPLHRVKVGLDAARPEVIMVVMIPPSRSPTKRTVGSGDWGWGGG